MKRLFINLFVVVSVFFMLPLISYAADIDEVKQYCEDEFYGYANIPSSDWEMIETAWGNDKYLVCGMWSGGSSYTIIIGDITSVTNPATGMYVISYNGTEMTRYQLSSSSFTRTINTNPFEYTSWTSFHDVGLQTLVDFENPYYDPTVPTPNYMVSMSRPSAWDGINSETNFFDITWSDYPDYYIQIGYKYSTPNGMKVALVDGNTNYIPLTYYNSSFYNIYSLEDQHTAQNLNNSVNSTSFVWNADDISDPESWSTSVPIWANNYNNSAYLKARNNWNTKYMYCMPLYGNKLEIFARLFYVADGFVYVGAWKHWNNTYPNEFSEEIPNNYQVGSAIPGYEYTSNNTEFQQLENTQTSIGDQTGANNSPTVVVNNLTQNYPDYPTVASYNHDNMLLQFFSTAKQLPSFFNGFTSFLSASLTWIPSYVWDIIAFGLLASITVMVIKIL